LGHGKYDSWLTGSHQTLLQDIKDEMFFANVRISIENIFDTKKQKSGLTGSRQTLLQDIKDEIFFC